MDVIIFQFVKVTINPALGVFLGAPYRIAL